VLKDVVLKYRQELASVLKGLSMDVMAGEEVGIVGRTPGAGESSIFPCIAWSSSLLVQSVAIDGVDQPFRLQESPQDPLL